VRFKSKHNNPHAGQLPRIPAIFKAYTNGNASGSKYIDLDGVLIRVSHHPSPAHFDNQFEVGPHVARTFEDIIPDLVIAHAAEAEDLGCDPAGLPYADITEADRLGWIKWWVGRELKRR
jgi:hypothetical protein